MKNETKPVSAAGGDAHFLLLNEILATLSDCGYLLQTAGSRQLSYVTLYEFSLETAYMEFGTLSYALNNPTNILNKVGGAQFLNTEFTDYRDVNETRYSISAIARAVDVLEARGEVRKVVSKMDGKPMRKDVYLTSEGLHAAYTSKYLKEYRKEEHETDLRKSTIATNRFSRTVSKITLAFLLLNFIVVAAQYLKPPGKTRIETNDSSPTEKQPEYRSSSVYRAPGWLETKFDSIQSIRRELKTSIQTMNN